MMKEFTITLFACMLFIVSSTTRAENPTNFSVKSALDNSEFKLSANRGRTVVLHFLLKTECPYCLRYTHEYAMLAATTPEIVHVFLKPDAVDDIKAWVSHLDKKDLEALPKVYRDPDAKLAKEYNVPDGYSFHGQKVHYPALIAIDGQGKELFRYVGKGNKDRMTIDVFKAKMAATK